MAEAKVGVVTQAQIDTGRGTPEAGKTKWDLKSPATWSVIWLVCAILFLFVL